MPATSMGLSAPPPAASRDRQATRRDYTQALHGFQHVGTPNAQPQLRSRQVVGVGQGLIEVRRAMGFAVIVLRSPDLAILPLDRQRLILQPAGQGVLAGALQSGQVDRRLDQRTNRPQRIQGPIETGEARLATADQGLHLTAFRTGHQHRRLDLINPLAAPGGETFECLGKCRFGFQLQDGIEAGENPQSFLGQIFLAVILTQLAFDQIEKAWKRAVGQTAALGNAQRLAAWPLPPARQPPRPAQPARPAPGCVVPEHVRGDGAD